MSFLLRTQDGYVGSSGGRPVITPSVNDAVEWSIQDDRLSFVDRYQLHTELFLDVPPTSVAPFDSYPVLTPNPKSRWKLEDKRLSTSNLRWHIKSVDGLVVGSPDISEATEVEAVPLRARFLCTDNSCQWVAGKEIANFGYNEAGGGYVTNLGRRWYPTRDECTAVCGQAQWECRNGLCVTATGGGDGFSDIGKCYAECV